MFEFCLTAAVLVASVTLVFGLYCLVQDMREGRARSFDRSL